jgi:hypothetical protein
MEPLTAIVAATSETVKAAAEIATPASEATTAGLREAAEKLAEATAGEQGLLEQMDVIQYSSQESCVARNETAAQALPETTASEGKDTFYPKVDADLEENGFDVVPEEQLTQGKGENQYVKPGDGIAVKGDNIVVVEKRAPAETSQSGASLRTDYIKETRADVDRRVANGETSKEVGLSETKVAQAEYSAHNFKDGITGVKGEGIEVEGKTIKPGYSVSQSESAAAEQALENRGISKYEKVEGSNGTVTYIWDLPPKRPS